MQARAGDKLTIGGPRGSLVVPEDYAWQLYVCDESGMPALRRRLEGLSRLAVRRKSKRWSPLRMHLTKIISLI
jgi:ferric-chelate reductase (NADPH)